VAVARIVIVMDSLSVKWFGVGHAVWATQRSTAGQASSGTLRTPNLIPLSGQAL